MGEIVFNYSVLFLENVYDSLVSRIKLTMICSKFPNNMKGVESIEEC